jgi:hypothetical protein
MTPDRGVHGSSPGIAAGNGEHFASAFWAGLIEHPRPRCAASPQFRLASKSEPLDCVMRSGTAAE